jgi:hypothetical protein
MTGKSEEGGLFFSIATQQQLKFIGRIAIPQDDLDVTTCWNSS